MKNLFSKGPTLFVSLVSNLMTETNIWLPSASILWHQKPVTMGDKLFMFPATPDCFNAAKILDFSATNRSNVKLLLHNRGITNISYGFHCCHETSVGMVLLAALSWG